MFGECFKIRGYAFNDPEIGRAADRFGGRARFLKQLVDRFVVQRAGILVGPGEEVSFMDGIEVDAKGLVDARLAAAESLVVFVAARVIEDAKWFRLTASRTLAIEELADFAIGQVETS